MVLMLTYLLSQVVKLQNYKFLSLNVLKNAHVIKCIK
jgi:hypothetical protein